jgi:putative methionine-R-sulfoxide reductase with GAF domain
LANAFAVQESHIAPQSLADIMEVQRSIARGKLDLDSAMRHIVESARNVANATGVAIGLLNGGRLTYRAGTGSAGAYIGEQVTASLTVSANTRTSREILRVENASTDTRIEADICRQFGANALLILPIYRNQALAGVLDILFSEAHVFQESEVRTYRLMAEQIEAAILQATPQERVENVSAELPTTADPLEPIPPVMDDIVPPPDFLMLPENEHSLYARCGAVLVAITELPFFRQSVSLATTITQRAKALHWPHRQRIATAAAPKDSSAVFKRSALFVTTFTQRAKNLTWPDRWRNWPTVASRQLSSASKRSAAFARTCAQGAKTLAWPNRWRNSTGAAARRVSSAFTRSALLVTQRAKNVPWPNRRRSLGLAAVAAILAVTALFAYRGRGPAQSLESSTLSNSNTVDQQAQLPKPQPGKDASALQPGSVPAKEANQPVTTLKRVRVGPHEVEYIGQDVTVRIFEDKRPIKRTRMPAGRVSHYGDDVTVRYFTPLPVTTKTASR